MMDGCVCGQAPGLSNNHISAAWGIYQAASSMVGLQLPFSLPGPLGVTGLIWGIGPADTIRDRMHSPLPQRRVFPLPTLQCMVRARFSKNLSPQQAQLRAMENPPPSPASCLRPMGAGAG